MNQVILGNSKEKLKELEDNSVDSVVTDPPYELGFMGKKWDSTGIAYDVELWKEVYRVLKPGGHLLSFGGTRTYHRMACAIEDAGFEIRDTLMWVYSSGFPKSHNISKAIDKILGYERDVIGRRKHPTLKDTSKLEEQANAAHGSNSWYREWDITASASPEAQQFEGWGTALKPANEPIVLARKPLSEKTVAKNVLQWGVGGLNIDGCRVGTEQRTYALKGGENLNRLSREGMGDNPDAKQVSIGETTVEGRWPANVIHDGSDEVLALFPETGTNKKGGEPYCYKGKEYNNSETSMFNGDKPEAPSNYNDFGNAARFFYCAKTSKKERTCNGTLDNKHPTVKPLTLISYLCRLITPLGGTVLDPFAGSGTTAIACMREGFNYILIELEEDSYNICLERINAEA